MKAEKYKAQDIFNQYYSYLKANLQYDDEAREDAKQCALIAVDEIDEIYQKLTPKDNPYYLLSDLEYWQEVKFEINKL